MQFLQFPNCLNLKEILEKLGDFTQNLAQNWSDWCMNGSLFWYLNWSTFKFRGATSLTKQNLSPPPGGQKSHLTSLSRPIVKIVFVTYFFRFGKSDRPKFIVAEKQLSSHPSRTSTFPSKDGHFEFCVRIRQVLGR